MVSRSILGQGWIPIHLARLRHPALPSVNGLQLIGSIISRMGSVRSHNIRYLMVGRLLRGGYCPLLTNHQGAQCYLKNIYAHSHQTRWPWDLAHPPAPLRLEGGTARNWGVSQLSNQSLYLNKFRKKYRVEIVAE